MCKIVIIEDDIDICNMIKKFLENNKYSVQYALTGIEGINLCKSFVPDLIIPVSYTHLVCPVTDRAFLSDRSMSGR